MAAEDRPIFRSEAIRHFVGGKEKEVLPRFVRPRTFIGLWILLGLLLAGLLLAWAAPVPVFVSGHGIVAEIDGKVVLVVLVPAESAEDLTTGQTVWVRRGTGREPSRTILTAITRRVQSPAVARQQFGLSSDAVRGAVVIATADLAGVSPEDDEPGAEAHLGSTFTVDIEVGTRRALSLLLP